MADQKNSAPPARNMPPATQMRPSPAHDPRAAKKKPSGFSSLPFWSGIFLSMAWIVGVVLVVAQAGPTHSFGGLSLTNWAIAISAIASPVALIWMMTAYLQRAADVQSIAEPLRRQLTLITGESGAAEARIRRFNQAIREQLELLRTVQDTSHDDLATIMDRVRQHRNDLEHFEHESIGHVKQIQDIVRNNMQHVEQVLEDKFTMMRVLDERLMQSGDSVARQTESASGHIAELLDLIESNAQRLTSALERTMQDSKKLSDTSRAQEASLMTAAESAAETLSGVSGKIDLSVARFLERAGAARSEAEHLASTLDTQARALDEFGNTLPVRVSEAEAVLRNVADRLYSSEQLAREQAVNLSEKLAQQTDGLQKFLDRLSERLGGFDGSLQKRHDDLDKLLARLGSTTDTFVQRWEGSITDLSGRTDHCLQRFTAVNDDTRRGADEVIGQMGAAAERYETAARRMQALSAESGAQLKAIAAEVSSQLAQFESLRTASQQAGQDVENRANAALQNLQHVLERLLSAREATQTIGETLVKDLYNAVDQNEQLIGRLNESAQMSVRALGIAAESLGRQEGELAGQARAAESMLQEAMAQTQSRAAAAEKGLRDQAAALMQLLGETQGKISSTEEKLQNFSTQTIAPIQAAIQQVDGSTDKGLQAMGRYGEGLQEQLSRLQQFTTRVGGMSEDLSRLTGDNLAALEQLNSRFIAVRTAQEETARQTIDQFGSMADRLQREVGALGDQSAQAVATLQQAAIRVGEQSSQLVQEAQSSGSQMQIVTTALQNEASQIRSILQKQADELGDDLSRAEKQFLTLGDTLKQRTDAAYGLLDRLAAHYNEVTRAAAQELEERTRRFEQSTTLAQGKADAFGAALTQNLNLVGTGATQLEAQMSQVATVSSKTVQQISALNEKLALTHEAASAGGQQTLARLDECNNSFMRQSNTLAEAAQTAVTLIQKAGMTFGEQAGKMLDNSHQTEQYIRNLTASTMALSEQAAQIRTSMEQQNQRLVTQLTELITQLETADSRLEKTSASASENAKQATEQLAVVAQAASSRIGASHQELQDITNRTETMLAALGTNIIQQTAALTAVSEQIGDQHTTITAANENQRTQLVELFDRLGTAHGEASQVAERTILHLTDSLQQIQRQLGTLSDQSQSTVANVRTAGSGFADQAGALMQSAQQAEQQARTILSVTAALQDQARQLREALHNEGERTNDLLGNLLGRLSTGGTELRDFSANAELTLTNLQNGVGQQSQALAAAIQQIGERQRSLTVALDAQRDVINGLLNRLALAQDETASTAERTVARLTDSTQQIAKQLNALDSQAQTTVAGVQAASAKFADEAGSLSMHAQQAEQQMRAVLSVTAGMQEQARTLRESMQGETARIIEQLTGVIAQIDTASGQLKQQSGAAIHVMDQSALQLETLTRNSGEQLQKQAEILTSAADQAETRIKSTEEKIRGHLRLVGDVTDQAEQQGRRVIDMTESAIGSLTNMRDAIMESDRQGGAALTSTSARLDEVKAALEDEVRRLSETSQTAAQQVTNAAQELSTQSDALRANLASSESALEEAARLVRDETVQLPATLARSTSQIAAATEELKENARETDKALVSIADRFIAVAGAARDGMVTEMKQIGFTATEAENILSRFSKTLAEQVESMQSGAGILATGQKDLVIRATEGLTQLAAASERLGQLRGDATQSAEKLAREFETLEARANATSQRLTQAGEVVGKNLEALTKAAQQAENQLMASSNGFREQLERIRAGVQGQTDDINRGLMQITAQLERTGNSLRTTTAGTVADVEKISARFDQTSREAASQLIEKTGRIRSSTEDVAQLVKGLGDQIDVLLDRLSMAGDGIKRHEGDFVSQLQTALSSLGSVAERLETSRTLAGNVSEHAITRLSEAATVLEQQMENLSNKSESSANVLRNVSKLYGDQTQSLNRGVGEAQAQVVVMNKTIEDMQQRTDRLRVSLKVQGEELATSLKQILTQLETAGDTVGETVDEVLRQQAINGLKKIS